MPGLDSEQGQTACIVTVLLSRQTGSGRHPVSADSPEPSRSRRSGARSASLNGSRERRSVRTEALGLCGWAETMAMCAAGSVAPRSRSEATASDTRRPDSMGLLAANQRLTVRIPLGSSRSRKIDQASRVNRPASAWAKALWPHRAPAWR